MGYTTRFILKTDAEMDDDFLDVLNEFADGLFDGCGSEFEIDDDCKWYNWKKDMTSVSKRYPSTVFSLHGIGEENGDVWWAHFLNGEVQVCKAIITFEPCKFTSAQKILSSD